MKTSGGASAVWRSVCESSRNFAHYGGSGMTNWKKLLMVLAVGGALAACAQNETRLQEKCNAGDQGACDTLVQMRSKQAQDEAAGGGPGGPPTPPSAGVPAPR